MYVPTPQGISHRLDLPRRFLARNLAKHDALQSNIKDIRREVVEK